ncbi:hypothetical protein H4R18_004918 [Coemansia javaensis]|uniref:Uncharacterized protein n=1 Tax=Coemansia javaensis TaxID=2761396 RepID=A0A9W8H477_9FUNG|nr:hypothetical protein H4R18_004918 [Coemansia javaensis]
MHLCDLPDDVLRLVLQESRCLALPFVYDEVWIKYDTRTSNSGVDTNTEPDDGVLASNLDLVASAGCVGAVKSVRIEVWCNHNPFPGLSKVAQAMRDAAAVWRRAQVLEIKLRSKLYADHLDAMLGLIFRFPNLTNLGIHGLALDEIQTDISIPEPGKGCVVAPLDTGLKTLSINVNQEQPSWEMVVPVAKYLLLQIPTLTIFIAAHAPEKLVMDFVQEYSEWHPHLAHVNGSGGGSASGWHGGAWHGGGSGRGH